MTIVTTKTPPLFRSIHLRISMSHEYKYAESVLLPIHPKTLTQWLAHAEGTKVNHHNDNKINCTCHVHMYMVMDSSLGFRITYRITNQ